jgi:hypothetical protein
MNFKFITNLLIKSLSSFGVALMILPALDDIEFSPLAWKEWLLYGKFSDFPSKASVYDYLLQLDRDEVFDWCKGITNTVKNERIRRLLNGYVVFDVLVKSKEIDLLKVKLWRLFEDLVEEILREIIAHKVECGVAYVDKWPGFQGLYHHQ